jgi:hypothetical protein
VALCIDEQPLPYRKVLLEGRAGLVHELSEDGIRHRRYYGTNTKQARQERST